MSTPDDPNHMMGRNMYYLMWALLLGLLAWLFHGILEKQQNPNQRINSQVQQDGLQEVALQRNRYGHYVATGTINGAPVVFMLDTGATDIAVPSGVATELGLKKGIPISIQTANGTANGYSTRINEVALGAIHLRDLPASINPGMEGQEVLLGMSFLKQVDFSQVGDTLYLRSRP